MVALPLRKGVCHFPHLRYRADPWQPHPHGRLSRHYHQQRRGLACAVNHVEESSTNAAAEILESVSCTDASGAGWGLLFRPKVWTGVTPTRHRRAYSFCMASINWNSCLSSVTSTNGREGLRLLTT